MSRIVFGHACSALLEPLLAGHVEVVVRLVEQEHVGVGAQQHLEGEALLLAAREGGQRTVAGHGERLAHGDRAAGVPQHLGVPAAGVAPRGVGAGERHPGAVAGVGRGGRLGLGQVGGAACWSGVGDRSRSMSRTVRPSSRQPTSCRITRSRPSTWTLPASGAWSPAMTRNRVVLPAPLAPTSATCSPSPTPKLTSLEQLDAARRAARHPVHVDRSHGPGRYRRRRSPGTRIPRPVVAARHRC